MRTADVIRLTCLAAIWGGSFVFMRVAAPALGPFTTAGARVSLAGLLLLAYFRAVRFDAQWRRHWRHYALVGVVNSAVPFSLYSYAALHIPASYSVILNATAPLFGAVFAALWLQDRLTARKLAGLALLPAALAMPPLRWPSPAVIGSVIALAVLCSAVAYLLYYRLMADVGPARALTVTFLMPVFGMAWGALFLGEVITPGMLAGCALVVGGTFLVLRAPAALRTTRAATTPSRGSTGP